MVGLGERAILRCERGYNFQLCYITHWGLGVLVVLQIFSVHALLNMRSRHHVGCACRWRGAKNGGVGRTSHSKV